MLPWHGAHFEVVLCVPTESTQWARGHPPPFLCLFCSPGLGSRRSLMFMLSRLACFPSATLPPTCTVVRWQIVMNTTGKEKPALVAFGRLQKSTYVRLCLQRLWLTLVGSRAVVFLRCFGDSTGPMACHEHL